MSKFQLTDLIYQAMELFKSSDRLIQIGEHINMCSLLHNKEQFNFFCIDQKNIHEKEFQQSSIILCEMIGLPKNTRSISLYCNKKNFTNDELKLFFHHLHITTNYFLPSAIFFTYSEEHTLNNILQNNSDMKNNIISTIFYQENKINIENYKTSLNSNLKNFLLINETDEDKKFITISNLSPKTILIL